MAIVCILSAAFQRKLSLPLSTCPLISECPPHPEHTGLGHRRQQGRASRHAPVRAGPTFLGAPQHFTRPQRQSCPGRGDSAPPASGTVPGAQVEAQRASERRADMSSCGGNPDLFPALEPWAQPAAGRRFPPPTSGRPRGPTPSSLRGPPTSDENRVREEGLAERRRHKGEDRREAETARRRAGDRAERGERRADASTAAQTPREALLRPQP